MFVIDSHDLSGTFSLLKHYISLVKPGIIYGNLITAIGAFFVASQSSVDIGLLCVTVLGISLLVASGCVVNNCIDRDIDGVMQRTCQRVMVQGFIGIPYALLYSAVLGIAGVICLFFTNLFALSVAVVGWFFYVVPYSLWFKRQSIYGTWVGSISGAAPPVAAYCAVSNRIDMGAVTVFLILLFWQIPHFYAIAIMRRTDYAAAMIPVFPIKKGVSCARIHMMLSAAAFMVSALLFVVLGLAGWLYAVLTLSVGIFWMKVIWCDFARLDELSWAKYVFRLSILAIFCVNLGLVAEVMLK